MRQSTATHVEASPGRPDRYLESCGTFDLFGISVKASESQQTRLSVNARKISE